MLVKLCSLVQRKTAKRITPIIGPIHQLQVCFVLPIEAFCGLWVVGCSYQEERWVVVLRRGLSLCRGKEERSNRRVFDGPIEGRPEPVRRRSYQKPLGPCHV